MKRFPLALVGALVGCGVAQAQLALPGAASAPPDTAATATPHAKKTPRAAARPPGIEAIVARPLLLNGAEGLLRFVAADKALRIEKFTLSGEVVSDPERKCRIDIVAETPIEAKSEGAPDGLERYSADIPVCPLSFDVLDGAVLVPAQATACVFQAADCQASPSGIWGPDGASLEKDAKTIAKARKRAEASIAASLRRLEGRDKSAVAGLEREQTDFASQRDDLCRDYAGEARHGFCAERMTEARAALLAKRAEPPKKASAPAGDQD